MVQVRQKVKHKKTFFFLEQLLIKHGAADKAMSVPRLCGVAYEPCMCAGRSSGLTSKLTQLFVRYVKDVENGLDFYYGTRSGAHKLVEFLSSMLPIRSKDSRKLISQDDHSNTKNYKFTLYAEIVPVCKHDLVVLPQKLCNLLGGISPLVLCIKISTHIHLLDPSTLRIVDVPVRHYWSNPFAPVMTTLQLIEYVVLDVDHGEVERGPGGFAIPSPLNANQKLTSKMNFAEVTVARESDFGNNDTTFVCVTHLGYILQAGDTVLGYDFSNAHINSDFKLKGAAPEVILVKKHYKKKNRARRRKWQLKTLTKELSDELPKKGEQERMERQYESFLADLEEDPEMRAKVQLYKKQDAERMAAESEMDEDEDFPEVPLDEMLDALAMHDEEELKEQEGAAEEDDEDEVELPMAV